MNKHLIPYGGALTRLKNRIPDLAPAELVMWVWAEDLPAYHQSATPWSWQGATALSDIVESYYRADELEAFTPRRRYISHKSLLARWNGNRDWVATNHHCTLEKFIA